MQWVIDLVKEWIEAEGYLLSAYVDRGDPAAIDFNLGDLITDSDWHDLDLSAIVPAGAKAVILRVDIMNSSAMSELQLRKNGNSNTQNTSKISTQANNIVFCSDMTVALDANRVIEYEAFPFGWSAITMNVKGWWL